jgi:hypothetical protein
LKKAQFASLRSIASIQRTRKYVSAVDFSRASQLNVLTSLVKRVFQHSVKRVPRYFPETVFIG